MEEEATDLCFEQKVHSEELADRLLEQKVRDSILQGLEEEQEDLFSNQTDRF